MKSHRKTASERENERQRKKDEEIEERPMKNRQRVDNMRTERKTLKKIKLCRRGGRSEIKEKVKWGVGSLTRGHHEKRKKWGEGETTRERNRHQIHCFHCLIRTTARGEDGGREERKMRRNMRRVERDSHTFLPDTEV